MLQERGSVKNPFISQVFTLANIAASQDATAIPLPGADIETVTFPKGGFIAGYSINKSADHVAGSLDFDIEVDGTSVVTIPADTTSVQGTFSESDAYVFSAGDTIGVSYTTDGATDPATVDVSVTVFVVLVDFNF